MPATVAALAAGVSAGAPQAVAATKRLLRGERTWAEMQALSEALFTSPEAAEGGPIGLVGASGTGLQHVTARIHQLGGGITHALGTGGRDLSDASFAALSTVLSRAQIIEFCALAGHYDAIAGILAALRVPMDFPD